MFGNAFLVGASFAHDSNRSYTSARPERMPYEAWNGKKLNVTHLREFGTPMWILSQGQHVQHKMLPKSQKRVLVRYDDGSKSVKFYNAPSKTILTLRNYKMLTLTTPALPEEVGIEPPKNEGENISLSEGENGESA